MMEAWKKSKTVTLLFIVGVVYFFLKFITPLVAPVLAAVLKPVVVPVYSFLGADPALRCAAAGTVAASAVYCLYCVSSPLVAHKPGDGDRKESCFFFSCVGGAVIITPRLSRWEN